MRTTSIQVLLACSVALAAACSTTPADADATGAEPPADGAMTIVGPIVSIDTDPWAYDGNAVVRVDADGRGRTAVELPARWNLCKAEPVDVAALIVGMRVQAVGAPSGDGVLVVCEAAAHRLVPIR
ncbi:hypothetical protein INQ40_05635 [Lysobacter sp. H21R4]|uniref:hypothetical protein n=1 Tax=Lysobacter sp. H21R4 TaxID=2781021 RepID=UPI001888933B|nr:hypothetical protein [Lysobacter sp. H21R4]QOY63702.1 hypothetical protein INQ40_05635 [Lysobacter sp. H21R4]